MCKPHLRHLRSAFQHSLFWALMVATFAHGATCLVETLLTLAGAIASMASTIFELKLSRRSSTAQI